MNLNAVCLSEFQLLYRIAMKANDDENASGGGDDDVSFKRPGCAYDGGRTVRLVAEARER